MGERVLSLRELNRATLARQLLLERASLSPVGVIEHVVGLQAQWPQAPYVGIWTRTTSFRRDELERELTSGAVVKANVIRQTLHLVTRHDYALMRAALSESNHMDQWPHAKRVAPTVRALAADGSVTTADALAHIEREYGLTGLDAALAWRGARRRMHVLHHHETALWDARPEGRFVAIDEPEEHDPVEARAQILRRYLAAFGPATRTDIDAWSMLRQPQIKPALERIEPLRRYRDERHRELLDVEDGLLPHADIPRAGSVPAQVGQPAARLCRPGTSPARAVSEDRHPAERRRRPNVPGRRLRGRHLASRWRSRRNRAVLATARCGPARGARRGRAAGSIPGLVR